MPLVLVYLSRPLLTNLIHNYPMEDHLLEFEEEPQKEPYEKIYMVLSCLLFWSMTYKIVSEVIVFLNSQK